MEYVHLVALCLGTSSLSASTIAQCSGNVHEQADLVIKMLTWLLNAGRVGDQLLYKLVCINVYMIASEQQRMLQEQTKKVSNQISPANGSVVVSQDFNLNFACVLAEHAINYLDVMAAKDHS